MSAQSTKNLITLKGSAQIIVEYLKFGIHNILFQRGIYPPESFKSAQHYGLTIFLSTDGKIEEFLKNVLQKAEEWLAKDKISKISMVITNAQTKEPLECWEFKMVAAATKNDNNNANDKEITSQKDLQRIQNEIRDVMRQISATVSFLPLLECLCSFDVMIYTKDNVEVPESWDETNGVIIQNAQNVQLRNFSTGIHQVETAVSYKMT